MACGRGSEVPLHTFSVQGYNKAGAGSASRRLLACLQQLPHLHPSIACHLFFSSSSPLFLYALILLRSLSLVAYIAGRPLSWYAPSHSFSTTRTHRWIRSLRRSVSRSADGTDAAAAAPSHPTLERRRILPPPDRTERYYLFIIPLYGVACQSRFLTGSPDAITPTRSRIVHLTLCRSASVAKCD